MIRDPFFSIIIPVYNVAPYLRECLDSVLAQTFTDWEAICVDDGSTDGSGAILDEYAAKDKRFRVIHQKNAGVSAARNKGIDVSEGEYICFVDGDDYLGCGWLQNYKNVADGADIIFSGFISDKNRVLKYKFDQIGLLLTGAAIAEFNFLENNMSFTRCVKTAILSTNFIRFPIAIPFSEDIIFNLKVLLASHTFSVVGRVDYYYRVVYGSAARRLYDSNLYKQIAYKIKPILQDIFAWFDVPYSYRHKSLGMLYVGHLRYSLRMAYVEKAPIKARITLIREIQHCSKGYKATVVGQSLLRGLWVSLFCIFPPLFSDQITKLAPTKLT